MTANIRTKTVEAMLHYHADQKPDVGYAMPVQTALSATELKAAGAQEFNGKLLYSITHKGAGRTFQLLPK